MVRSRPHEGPFVAHGGSTTAAAAVVVQAPEEVFVTTRGVCCFHKGTCGHIRGKAPRSVRRSLDCFCWRTSSPVGHRSSSE